MPLPGSGMETIATYLSGETVTSVGPEAVALSSSMPFCDLGARDVLGLDDGERGQRAAGERGLDALVGLHDRQVVRQAGGARVERLHVQRRGGEHEQDRGRRATTATTGRSSALSMTQPQTRDSPWLRWRRRPMNGTRPFSTLSPSLEMTAGRTVTLPSIATATTSIVPTAKEVKTALPARNMPAIAIITVRPETSTALPDVAAANSSAASRGASRVSLLHLAAQVEHRVVDADREADQEDHGVRGLLHRDDLADRADQAERADHGRDRQQQRDAGGDQRAERDDQDEQRDREAEELRALEVVVERGAERLVGGGVAELLDPQVGVRLLRRRGGRQRGVDDLVVRSSSSGMLNVTSAERPSLEIWPSLPLASGDSTSWTCLAFSSLGDDVVDRRP